MNSEQLYFEGFGVESSNDTNSVHLQSREEVGNRDLVLGFLSHTLRFEYRRIGALNSGEERNLAIYAFNQKVAREFPRTFGVVYDVRKGWEVVIAKPHFVDE